jgi:hypothetical protein
VDIESIGHAVARRWGLDEATLQMIRRLPRQAVLHTPDGDAELLRWTASCANDLLDLAGLPPREQSMALQRLAQRYARGLKLTLRDLQEALIGSAGTTTAEVLLADSGNALYAMSGDPVAVAAADDAEVPPAPTLRGGSRPSPAGAPR